MYKCLCLLQQLANSERGHGFEREQGVVKGSQGGKGRKKCSNSNIISKVFLSLCIANFPIVYKDSALIYIFPIKS